MVNVLDCNIVVSLNSSCSIIYIFRLVALGKVLNPIIPPNSGLNNILLFFFLFFFFLQGWLLQKKIDMPLSKRNQTMIPFSQNIFFLTKTYFRFILQPLKKFGEKKHKKHFFWGGLFC